MIMTAELDKILAELTTLAERAEFFAGSDNETTAERYGAVEDAIGDAILTIKSAISYLSDIDSL
jgi:hypothetical protein